VFRAVENGKYVLQVANTGITGLVDPHGRILKTLDLNSNEMGLFEVMPNDRITVYTRFGDSLVVIPSIVMILIPLFDLRFRRRWNHGDKSKIRVHASQDSR
ncbi:MAG: apolipoprotein N-acyltransferase, partial [Thermotogae bacterium]|nr:apolipoprotein N-acyltransferase [Thermotogota bacterium]